MRNITLILLISFLLTSCFKTSEEIRREKLIDQQLEQSARIIAELSGQVNDLKGGLATTSGQLEEFGHKSKVSSQTQFTTLTQQVNQLSAQIKILTEENVNSRKQYTLISQELKNQKKFLQKITKTLGSLGGSSSTSARKSSKSLLKQAHKAFEKNKKKKAKSLYLEVLAKAKINNATKNHVYFNLGLLDYWAGSYDQALIYFSKIYTKYPKSSFAPRSLLYIGRSFRKTKKINEATATFNEVINNYPKSKQAITAKKELKK